MRVTAVVSELNEPLYVDLSSLGIQREHSRLIPMSSRVPGAVQRLERVGVEGREGLSGGEAKEEGGTCVADLLSRCSVVIV